MDAKRTLAAAAVAVAFAMPITACGSSSNKLSDKVAEKAVEQAGGGKVKIDTSGGGVVYKGPNGEVLKTDKNGNVQMSDANGSSSYSTGGNAKLPAEWPKGLDLPKSAKIISAGTQTVNGKKTMTVSASLPSKGDIKSAYDTVKQEIEGAGYTVESDSFSDNGASGSFGMLRANKGGTAVTASIGSGGTTGAYFSMTVEPKG